MKIKNTGIVHFWASDCHGALNSLNFRKWTVVSLLLTNVPLQWFKKDDYRLRLSFTLTSTFEPQLLYECRQQEKTWQLISHIKFVHCVLKHHHPSIHWHSITNTTAVYSCFKVCSLITRWTSLCKVTNIRAPPFCRMKIEFRLSWKTCRRPFSQ